MKRAPTILAAIFQALQISRVALYVNFVAANGSSPVLGWLFSIALVFTIFLSSYWAGELGTEAAAPRPKPKKVDPNADNKKPQPPAPRNLKTKGETRRLTVRNTAVFLLVIAIAAEGVLNIAEVYRHTRENAQAFEMFTAYLYGGLPTAATALLSLLQRFVDRAYRRAKLGSNTAFSLLIGAGDKYLRAVAAVLAAKARKVRAGSEQKDATRTPRKHALSPAPAIPGPYHCKVCDKWDPPAGHPNPAKSYAAHLSHHSRDKNKHGGVI